MSEWGGGGGRVEKGKRQWDLMDLTSTPPTHTYEMRGMTYKIPSCKVCYKEVW